MTENKLILGTALLTVCVFSLVSCSSNKIVKAGKASAQTEVVETLSGPVRGVFDEKTNVELFAGIPYAKAPVGDLRWKEPQDVEPWTQILEADSFAPLAMQERNSAFVNWVYHSFIYHKDDRQDSAPISEDCLYLNIWRPTDIPQEQKLPVLVYIHGGSLMSGGSYAEAYDGTVFAQKGVITVTIAYRLGVFGYFALPELAQESPNGTTGNYGLLDQIKALEWIHSNISLFGGDAENITIAGESAGASSVNALCASPLAKGLFKKAIGESSAVNVKWPSHTFRTMEEAQKTGKATMAEFKVSTLEELRAIPANKLIKTKLRNSSMTVDGYALTELPWETYSKGNNNEEAVIGGFNFNEGYFFNFFGGNGTKKNYRSKIESYFGKYTDEVIALYPGNTDKQAKDNWNQICGAVWFANGHYVWNNLVSNQGKNAWEYYFTKENGGIGTNHSGEIIYAYGNVPKSKHYTQADHKLEHIMASYWINFISDGNPNGRNRFTDEELPEWKTNAEAPGKVLELGENVSMVDDPHLGLYPIVEKVMEDQKAAVLNTQHE